MTDKTLSSWIRAYGLTGTLGYSHHLMRCNLAPALEDLGDRLNERWAHRRRDEILRRGQQRLRR